MNGLDSPIQQSERNNWWLGHTLKSMLTRIAEHLLSLLLTLVYTIRNPRGLIVAPAVMAELAKQEQSITTRNLKPSPQPPTMPAATRTLTYPGGIKAYYQAKIESAELTINERTQNLRRLEAQRNALNARGQWNNLIWDVATLVLIV